MLGLTVLQLGCVPDYVRILFPFFEKHKSLVHEDLMTFITTDALTGKTFSEIGKGICNFRINDYLRKRSFYLSIMKKYHVNTITGVVSLPFFSKFDDEEGFNEILQPTDQYLVDFFEDYVTGHQKFIDDAQDAIPFCPVISTDHTFRVQSKTLDYHERGAQPSSENAFFTIMNGNLQVQQYRSTVGTSADGEGWQQDMKALKTKIDIYNANITVGKVPYPTYCCVDNCCSQRQKIQEVFPDIIVIQDGKHIINRLLD